MRVHVALCALAISAPLAAAAEFYAEGSFLVGDPVAWTVADACGLDGASEGVDSSCIDLPEGLGGLGYAATFSSPGHSMGIGGGQVCFYDAVQHIACYADADLSARIPLSAKRAAFSVLVGATVQWTFRV